MRRATVALEKIADRIARGEQLVLFLDFDGTLAPIVRDPSEAKMSAKTKALVGDCAKHFAVYIVSGRDLSDVAKRAAVPGVHFAGNHGMQWNERGAVKHSPLSRAALSDVQDAMHALSSLRGKPGVIFEHKGISFAFHYRKVPLERVDGIRAAANRLLAPIVARGRIEVLHQKKVLDIRPRGWHKGDFVRMILQHRRRSFAVYLGDDRTDEDAFRALHGGFSIRIGRSEASAARYYLPSRESVDGFLAALCSVANIHDRELKR